MVTTTNELMSFVRNVKKWNRRKIMIPKMMSIIAAIIHWNGNNLLGTLILKAALFKLISIITEAIPMIVLVMIASIVRF
jgi:hypothetical protein